jgi:hypothetical protein
VAELVQLGPARWAEGFAAAGLLARCSDLARKDETLTADDRAREATDYSDRAVKLLAKAREMGWKSLDDAWISPDLRSLRDRDDFKKLVGRQ